MTDEAKVRRMVAAGAGRDVVARLLGILDGKAGDHRVGPRRADVVASLVSGLFEKGDESHARKRSLSRQDVVDIAEFVYDVGFQDGARDDDAGAKILLEDVAREAGRFVAAWCRNMNDEDVGPLTRALAKLAKSDHARGQT